MMRRPDSYFALHRHNMIKQCESMGMDPKQIDSFLTMKGISEENISWILQYVNNPNYVN